jgi:hypothetical protein
VDIYSSSSARGTLEIKNRSQIKKGIKKGMNKMLALAEKYKLN